MSKPILGLLLGGILGIFDGLSALVSAGSDPVIRDGIVGIVIGSTFKGVIAGVAIGYFSKKFNSLPLGIAFGFAIGLFLAFLIALMQGKYWFEIMIPGAMVGVIVGYATQRYGARSVAAEA